MSSSDYVQVCKEFFDLVGGEKDLSIDVQMLVSATATSTLSVIVEAQKTNKDKRDFINAVNQSLLLKVDSNNNDEEMVWPV